MSELKPVAWLYTHTNGRRELSEFRHTGPYDGWTETPLYTRQPDPAALVEALGRAKRLIDEVLPKFNWGASALDVNAIQLLNEVPGEVNQALAAWDKNDA